ncbi:MAG: hypothetical protein JWR88_2340 [Pseudonocardia sp.]|nr:hypothetical protein [Pseudonocardia sp.]
MEGSPPLDESGPAVSENSNLSFDRMRGMLMRAAEIRDSEQQQIFDSLDEIHSRLATLDSLGAVRKRLAELPDRTEVSVLAERLDETVAKLDGQEAAINAAARGIDAIVDKLAKPFAQLDGRLDAIAGRMEGVSGRMEGLDDRLGGLHKRLDDLDNRLDRNEMRLDGLPSALTGPVRERVDGLERTLRDYLNGTREAVQQSLAETGEGVRHLVGETGIGLHNRLEELASRPAVDPTEQLTALADRLETLATRLDTVAARLDAVEDGITGRLGNLGGTIEQGIGKLDTTLLERPDRAALANVVHQANKESERRSAGQLDEAMATFAEIILGRGAAAVQPPVMPPPRPAQRRGRSKPAVKTLNGRSGSSVADDGDDTDD